MSSIINPTSPASSLPLPNGGFDIIGFEDSPNRLNGSEQGDSITGGNLADVLSGLAGNDSINGLAGDDVIFGCDGDDVLQGSEGNDTLRGGLGRDVLDGGAGQDQLIAEGRGNILTGGSGLDRFEVDLTRRLVNSLDQITDYQSGEKIVIRGQDPIGEITYNQITGRLSLNGQEIIQLSPGQEINLADVEYIGIEPTSPFSSTALIDGGSNITGFADSPNRLYGSEVRDSITGGNLADVISGLAGNDTIDGLAGDDIILGGDGDDIILGGDGNDYLDGNAGTNLILGDAGNDTLRGLPGNVLDGGTGEDLLIAEGGGNILTGGSEIDRFEIDLTQRLVNALDRINDYQRGEKIVIQGNAPTGEITYNQTTGIISLNGEEVVELTPELDIDLGDVEYL